MIKSGTLRPLVNESIDNKTVSKVLLFLMLVYYHYLLAYRILLEEEDQDYRDMINKIIVILRKKEGIKINEYIEAIKVVVDKNREFSKQYLLTPNQAKYIRNLLDNEYTYQSDYIKDSLFKLIGNSNKSTMSKSELKLYILENDKIEFILEKLGCKRICYVSNPHGDDYYKCTNPDGNNPEAIRVYTNEYLNVTNFTRNYGDVADIFTLIQRTLKLDFGRALIWTNHILGLTNLTESELRLLSIEANARKNEITIQKQRNAQKEKEQEKQAYLKALETDRKVYEAAEPILTIDWFKEGIIAPTRRAFGIRYFEYGDKYRQIIFPIKNCYTGEVIAYQKRMILNKDEERFREANGQPKYLVTEGYNRNENVYGLFENKDEINEKKQIVIFESPKSVMKRWTFQDRTAVAIQGHYLSGKQRDIIAKNASMSYFSAYMESCRTGESNIPWYKTEIIIAFDKDVDEKAIIDTCRYLANYEFSRGFEISYIYDRWGILKDKESPADVGNKNYNYLFDNRTKFISK